eukprot:6616908-Alexandrium_andersonii.AAC.1
MPRMPIFFGDQGRPSLLATAHHLRKHFGMFGIPGNSSASWGSPHATPRIFGNSSILVGGGGKPPGAWGG